MSASPDDGVPPCSPPPDPPNPGPHSVHENNAAIDPLTVLARRVQAGDVSAWPELVARMARPLMAIIAGLLPRGERDDAFGEVCKKIFERIPTFRGVNERGEPVGFVTFACKIADGECRDIHRRLTKRKHMSLEGLATVPSEPRPSEEGLPLDFEEAYSKLTTDQKRVFDLHYEQRLSFKEIATLLERKEAVLRSVYSRAVARLRRELAAYNEVPGDRKRCRRRSKR